MRGTVLTATDYGGGPKRDSKDTVRRNIDCPYGTREHQSGVGIREFCEFGRGKINLFILNILRIEIGNSHSRDMLLVPWGKGRHAPP